MKKALVILCIVAMASVWGCATEHCARRTFWTELADWMRLDENAQRSRTRVAEDDYWVKFFNLDAHSLGYWGNCQ